MSRKECHQRLEQKKETIRKEIFNIMYKCEETESAPDIVNKAINIMIRKNPQEAHLVRSVCAEIRENPEAFCNKYLKENK